jgi:hypothetical protein
MTSIEILDYFINDHIYKDISFLKITYKYPKLVLLEAMVPDYWIPDNRIYNVSVKYKKLNPQTAYDLLMSREILQLICDHYTLYRKGMSWHISETGFLIKTIKHDKDTLDKLENLSNSLYKF